MDGDDSGSGILMMELPPSRCGERQVVVPFLIHTCSKYLESSLLNKDLNKECT